MVSGPAGMPMAHRCTRECGGNNRREIRCALWSSDENIFRGELRMGSGGFMGEGCRFARMRMSRERYGVQFEEHARSSGFVSNMGERGRPLAGRFLGFLDGVLLARKQ